MKGVARAAGRLDARGHFTFGGCLEEGARGWIARSLLKQAASIAKELEV